MKEANETGGEQASEGAEEREAEAAGRHFKHFIFEMKWRARAPSSRICFAGPPRKGRGGARARRQTGRARAAWLGAATELARAALN